MKPSEIAARELRAGLAYLLRLGERRAEAGLPPLPDVHDEAYWREWCNNHRAATVARMFSLAAPKQKTPPISGASRRSRAKVKSSRRRGPFPFPLPIGALPLPTGATTGGGGGAGISAASACPCFIVRPDGVFAT
jgi:hypothetical protein